MTKNDPELYRALSIPFDDTAAADNAIRLFFAAVEAARKEHGIADVAVVAQVSIRRGDAPACDGIASAYYGDPLRNKLAMLARMYGEAKQEHEEVLGNLIEASSGRPGSAMNTERDERPATAEEFLARRQARRITRLDGALREALDLIDELTEDTPDRAHAVRCRALRKVLG